MLRLLILWELQLALVVAMVAAGEVIGLVFARSKGLSKNVSRLVTHGFIAVACLIYSARAYWSWSALGDDDSLTSMTAATSLDVTAVILGVAMMLVAVWELWQHARAMALRLTTSVPRLITHLVLVILIAILVGITMSLWQPTAGEHRMGSFYDSTAETSFVLTISPAQSP